MTPASSLRQIFNAESGAVGSRIVEFAEVVVVPLIVANQVQIHCHDGRCSLAGGVQVFYGERSLCERSQQRAPRSAAGGSLKLENAKIEATKRVAGVIEIRSF